MLLNKSNANKPTPAYVFATWAVLAIGVIGYLVGLWNAYLQLNEKGFYFAVFILAMFSAVTLQKSIRDKEEGIAVTNIFLGMCWVAFGCAIALLVIGLFNAGLALSEKGFYVMAFILSLFAVITVQKNTRDLTDETGVTDRAAFPRSARGAEVIGDMADLVE